MKIAVVLRANPDRGVQIIFRNELSSRRIEPLIFGQVMITKIAFAGSPVTDLQRGRARYEEVLD